jgi:hypothetical protein
LAYPEKSQSPAIDVMINNKKYYACYETRIKTSIISKNILKETGIENIDDKTSITIPQIILPNGIILNNIVFDITENAGGIIQIAFGLSAFNEYNVLVSYKQNKLFFYNGGTLPDYMNSWIPVDPVDAKPPSLYINGGADGSKRTYLFCLSTGTTLFGGISKRHANIVVNQKVPFTSPKQTIIIGGKKYKNLYYFNCLSKEEQKDFKEKYKISNKTDIILGYEFFRNYDIFIDVNTNKLYIEQP